MTTAFAIQQNSMTGTGHACINAGRRAAIEAAYETHLETVGKFVYYKVGNREDAEDITSQIFIKAANSLDTNQDERTQLAWLYQVARTTVTDYWRLYYKGPTSSLEALEDANGLHVAAEPAYTGGGAAQACSATPVVMELLNKLPENYRRVLCLRFLKGYSLKETAAAMQVTEANVKVLQHRALQKAAKLDVTLPFVARKATRDLAA